MNIQNRIRKSFFIGLEIIFVFFFMVRVFSESSLKPDQSRVDFKQVAQDSKISKTFKIQNTGKSKVKILDLKTSCKCINAEIDRKELPPGESAETQLMIDTTDLYGEKNYTLFIRSDAPQTPLISIAVACFVLPPPEAVLSVFPENLTFRILKDNKARSRLILKNLGSSDLNFELSDSSAAIAFSENQGSIPGGGKKILNVFYDNGKGIFKGELTLHSNSKKNKELSLPWRAAPMAT